MKRFLIAAAGMAALIAIAILLQRAIAAPSRATASNLAVINGLTVGKTTESELLTRTEFQKLERMCFQADCFYSMATENTLLNRLRLAPQTNISTTVQVRDGLVTGVSVFVMKRGLPTISLRQMLELPPECSGSPCVRRSMPPSNILLGIGILFNNDSSIRNHLPEAVNGECLSRLHGCNSYAELMPITKTLNMEAGVK